MSDIARIDQDYNKSLQAASADDGESSINLWAKPDTHELLTTSTVSSSAHPAADPYGSVQFYVKDGLLVARFDDAGTIRYKYLNMAGTNATWVHTTLAP